MDYLLIASPRNRRRRFGTALGSLPLNAPLARLASASSKKGTGSGNSWEALPPGSSTKAASIPVRSRQRRSPRRSPHPFATPPRGRPTGLKASAAGTVPAKKRVPPGPQRVGRRGGLPASGAPSGWRSSWLTITVREGGQLRLTAFGVLHDSAEVEHFASTGRRQYHGDPWHGAVLMRPYNYSLHTSCRATAG
jgi:hypothetical protein